MHSCYNSVDYNLWPPSSSRPAHYEKIPYIPNRSAKYIFSELLGDLGYTALDLHSVYSLNY